MKRRTLLGMVAISTAATFLVGGYEFVRSASSSLFITTYGAAMVPYAMTAVPFAVGLVIYGYGLILSRLGARRALSVSMVFSAAVFLACYAGLRQGVELAAAVLYVYRQAYIVLLIEQYWSLINSTLTPEQAKRYNGPIIGGASLGPIICGLIVSRTAETFGTEQFVLLAAASLIPAALLAHLAYRLVGEPRPSKKERGGLQGHMNLRLFSRSRTLLLLLFVVGITQIVSTSLNLRFYSLLETSIPTLDARTAYLGGFWFGVNSASLVLQFVISPIMLTSLPLRWVHMGIPVVHFAAAAALALHPTLRVAAGAFLLFKCLDYSLFRAAKEVLYIPLSFDARYRAKQVIDTFTYRFSMGLTGGILSVITKAAGAIPGAAYTVLAMASTLAWAGLAVPLTNAGKTARHPKNRR